MPERELERLLERSQELEERVFAYLGDEYEPAPSTLQVDAAVGLAFASIEHGRALRTLVATSQFAPAFCLLRPQFEALVRAAWALWAAREEDVQRLRAPLTAMSEKEAAKLPMLAKMLEQLIGKAPDGLSSELAKFKDASLPALNSFVHGGIHVLSRQVSGYVPSLVVRVVKQSNALLTMAGMLLALLSADAHSREEMRRIQRPFADCLPQLLAP